MTRRRFLVSAALLAIAVDGAGQMALASAPAPSIEISVIHAQRSDGGGFIDPRLRDLPRLTHDEPFVRYNVYHLLDHTRLALERGKPASLVLINGRTLKVTLADVTGSGADRRYRMRGEIAEPQQEAFLKLLEVTASIDEPFFVGGQSYDGGTLFLEIVLRP